MCIKQKKLYLRIWREDSDYSKIYISSIPYVLVLICVTGCLVYYKYTGFLQEILPISSEKQILAPLGISFIVFSTISYIIDVWRGDAEHGSLIDCALYITFFPKVVSGPIVLWKEFQNNIYERRTSLDDAVQGINRIAIGFVKKVILADTFGACIAQIGQVNIDRITAIGTLLLYMLQIYYDFSGYSDIAIGLARVFGFHFKENFNFPYRSKSISEFWRRWHISLGTWFRTYVYFPLGGSRVGKKKTLRNLAIVFALTGIWHGAGWNYILWGAINAAIVVAERIAGEKKFYQRIPDFIKYIITMLIVMMFWQLFRFTSISEVGRLLGIILGTVKFEKVYYTWKHYYDMRIIIFSLIGVLGATVVGNKKVLNVYKNIPKTSIGFIVQEIILIILFVVAFLFMINSTYSPFIYFQY